MLKRTLPLLTLLAACEQPAQPCLAPDGGTFTRVAHPELLTYTDAKAVCEAGGQRLALPGTYDDRAALIAACSTPPCWTDGWGSRSAAEGGGVGVVVVDGATLIVVPSSDLATYLAHPICEALIP